MTKKKQREELFHTLADAENEIVHLERHVIPITLEKLKELKPTKKEIEENELESYYEWTL